MNHLPSMKCQAFFSQKTKKKTFCGVICIILKDALEGMDTLSWEITLSNCFCIPFEKGFNLEWWKIYHVYSASLKVKG